jgi:hypothetical protein
MWMSNPARVPFVIGAGNKVYASDLVCAGGLRKDFPSELMSLFVMFV